MNCEKNFMNFLILTFLLITLCEARGGRRGGSFGGLFGSWRKYKKPSTGSGSTRRIVSSSPVHTPITKALNENKKYNGNDKFQKPNSFYNNYNTPPLPAGGSYYHNTAALPGNAIYVNQAPPRGAEFGDFLTGYLTGRLLTMGFSPPAYHVTHVYRDNPPINDSNTNNSNSKVIIVNDQPVSSTVAPPYTAPLETTTTAATTTDITITTTTEIPSKRETRSTTTELSLSTAEAPTFSPYGIICMPMFLNETNAEGEQVQVERIVCYPAPAPPTPQKDLTSKPVEIAGDIIEP